MMHFLSRQLCCVTALCLIVVTSASTDLPTANDRSKVTTKTTNSDEQHHLHHHHNLPQQHHRHHGHQQHFQQQKHENAAANHINNNHHHLHRQKAHHHHQQNNNHNRSEEFMFNNSNKNGNHSRGGGGVNMKQQIQRKFDADSRRNIMINKAIREHQRTPANGSIDFTNHSNVKSNEHLTKSNRSEKLQFDKWLWRPYVHNGNNNEDRVISYHFKIPEVEPTQTSKCICIYK